MSLHAPERRAARRPGAAEPQVPDRRTAGRLQPLPRRTRRATSSPSSTACSTASTTRRSRRAQLVALVRGTAAACSLQVQPDPVQPVPGVGPDALAAASGCRPSPRCCSDAGIVTTVRKTRGDDIDAACGQLAGEVQDRTRVAERMRARGADARRIAARHRVAGAPRRRRRSSASMSTRSPSRRAPALLIAARLLAGVLGDAAADHRRGRRRPRAPARATASPTPTSRRAARAPARAWSWPSAYFGQGQIDDRARRGQAGARRRPELRRGLQPARPDLRAAWATTRWPRRASAARCSSTRATPTRCTTTAGFLCQQKRYRRGERAVRAGAGACRSTRDAAAHAADAGRLPGARRPAGRGRSARWSRPTSSTRPTRSPAINLAEVLYRRGDYERARFYIRRVNASRSVSNAQTLWLAARIEHKLGNRPGVAELRPPAARPLPAVARGGGLRARRRSMSDEAGAAAPASRRRSAPGGCCARRARRRACTSPRWPRRSRCRRASSRRWRPTASTSCPTPPSRARWRRPSAAR